jgi:phosphate transport system permease protein
MTRRRGANGAMWALCILATILAIIPLVLVIGYVTIQGIGALSPSFFLADQRPPDEVGGGLRYAIVGTLMLIGIASCLGLPIGILGGIYLAEFGNNRLGFAIRFAADVLNGVPSIVIGVFVYAIAVLPVTKATQGNITYSAWAGGLALGIMMIPTVMRTSEEIVRLVPVALRDGALALGDTRWHSVFKVVLGSAKGGILTGVLLAVARISGETAPLLFTALSSNYLNLNPSKKTASLPVTIFTYATSASENWIRLAWGGSFILVAMIFILSLAARATTRGKR